MCAHRRSFVPTTKWRCFVGVCGPNARQVFMANEEPTALTHPEYQAVIGPFRTRRGATWAANHPQGFQTVAEAEEKARVAWLTRPRVTRNRTGDRLRARGFDLTRYDRTTKYWYPRCSQCQVTVINGVVCHEHRCPNQTGD